MLEAPNPRSPGHHRPPRVRLLVALAATLSAAGCGSCARDEGSPSAAVAPTTSAQAADTAAAARARAVAEDLPEIGRCDAATVRRLTNDGGDDVVTLRGAELDALREALEVVAVPPSGGEEAATVTFTRAGAPVREIWVYRDGEWGVRRPGTSFSLGRSERLAALVFASPKPPAPPAPDVLLWDGEATHWLTAADGGGVAVVARRRGLTVSDGESLWEVVAAAPASGFEAAGLTARPLGGDGAAAVIVATRAFDPAVVLGVDAAVSVRGVLGTRLHVTRDVNVENRFPHAARLAEHVVWDLATHGVVATDAEPAMCGAGPGERDEAAAALATDDPLGRAAATIAGEARCVEVTLRAAGGEPRVERRFAIASDYVDQDGVWGTYTRSTVVSRPAPTRGPGAPPALALAYLAATGRDGRFGWTYPPTDPTARARALAAFEAGGGARGGR